MSSPRKPIRVKDTDRRLSLYADADLRRDVHRFRIVEKSYGFRIESPHDSEGHGDMGSAFALAMLAASEIAATPQITVGGWEVAELSTGLTDFQQRQREYAEEREELSNNEDPHSLRTALENNPNQSPFTW